MMIMMDNKRTQTVEYTPGKMHTAPEHGRHRKRFSIQASLFSVTQVALAVFSPCIAQESGGRRISLPSPLHPHWGPLPTRPPTAPFPACRCPMHPFLSKSNQFPKFSSENTVREPSLSVCLSAVAPCTPSYHPCSGT